MSCFFYLEKTREKDRERKNLENGPIPTPNYNNNFGSTHTSYDILSTLVVASLHPLSVDSLIWFSRLDYF